MVVVITALLKQIYIQPFIPVSEEMLDNEEEKPAERFVQQNDKSPSQFGFLRVFRNYFSVLHITFPIYFEGLSFTWNLEKGLGVGGK